MSRSSTGTPFRHKPQLATAAHVVLCRFGPLSSESVRNVVLEAFARQRPDRFDGARIPAKSAIRSLAR